MKRSLWILLLLCLLCCAAFAEGMPPEAAGSATDLADGRLFQFHQINVGMANAHLAVYGERGIMIDGGKPDEETEALVLEYLEKSGVTHLDAYIATHWHLDHTGNMNPILARFADDTTYVFGPSEDVYEPKKPIGGGHYVQMRDGDVYVLGPVTLTCVGPKVVTEEGRVNQDSLNVIITYGSRRFMITGDYVVSKDVMNGHKDELAGIDVFQFPHHGIGTKHFCVDPYVLRHMKPAYILVPGNGSFKPKYFMLDRYVRSHWLDNGSGNIVFLTDGADRLELHEHAAPGAFAGV